jgi:hypothetical protein
MWLLLIGYQGIILDLEKLALGQLTRWFHMNSRSRFWGSGWYWGVLPYIPLVSHSQIVAPPDHLPIGS